MIKIPELYCVCDIETNTIEETPNPLVDELRYIGFKFKDKLKCFHYTELDKVQTCIDYFDYIVGHNFKEYDKIILERYGINFYRKIIVDTYEIANNRLKSMLYIDLNVGDKSLGGLCDKFSLNNKKTAFIYSLLQKDILEGEEYELLEKYLFNDLNSNDEIFQYFYNLFIGFKEYMSKENQRKMCWLINKPGSTAYKCICNIANLSEEYEEIEKGNKLYEGGFVSIPYVDFIEG